MLLSYRFSLFLLFFKQKTAYEMRISDWSSDVCSSDLVFRYEHNGNKLEIVPSVKGLATIHDKDILIYCIYQLIGKMNQGERPSRTLHLTPRDLLVWTNRQTDSDGYDRLRSAFERLSGTRITTNIKADGEEITDGFGLIKEWRNVRQKIGQAHDYTPI